MKFVKIMTCILLSALIVLSLAACIDNTPRDDSPATHVDRAGAILKKGVSVSRYADGSQASANNINSLDVSWYYNWSSNPSGNLIEAEYVPMVWGGGNVNQATISAIKSGYQAGNYKALLTFNEPDGTISGGGSVMTVDQAIALWPQLESIGIPLSSPATTNMFEADGSWNRWFDSFMNEAKKRNYRIDFIAIHCYQDFSDSGAHNTLRRQLIQIYEKYQLPIWITEFGCIDISTWNPMTPGGNPACTQDAAKKYTKNVTDMLEGLGFVERYCWFVDNFTQHGDKRPTEGQYTTLFNDDDTISQTGTVYKAQKSSVSLQIEQTTLKSGKVGSPYSVKLTASGGTGNYRFTTNAPTGVTTRTSIPRGMSISPSGELYGKPEVAGTYNVCVTVTDDKGQIAFRIYELIIE